MSCDDAAATVALGAVPSSPWPSEIRLDSQARTLEIVWDGQLVSLSHRALRRSCRCSVCESERRMLNRVLPVDPEVTLLKAEPLGTTALQLFFSDGHERGIYPWTYLKQIAFGPFGDMTSGFAEALTKGWRDE